MSGGSYSELRTKLDGNDGFVTGGHRIMKTAGATRHASRMKRVPVWALDDEKIKGLIQRCFPNFSQRERAGRMIRIIYLYYRAGLTAAGVAEELKMSVKAVTESLRRINRTMNRPAKPRGRPKRNAVGIQNSNGNSGDDSHITL